MKISNQPLINNQKEYKLTGVLQNESKEPIQS